MFTTRYRRATEGGRVVLHCSDDGILWKELPESEVLNTGGASAIGRWDSGWLYVLKGLVPLDGDKVAVPYLARPTHTSTRAGSRWSPARSSSPGRGGRRTGWWPSAPTSSAGSAADRWCRRAGRSGSNAPHRSLGLRARGDRDTARGPGVRHAPAGRRRRRWNGSHCRWNGNRHRAADRDVQTPQRRLPLADRGLERTGPTSTSRTTCRSPCGSSSATPTCSASSGRSDGDDHPDRRTVRPGRQAAGLHELVPRAGRRLRMDRRRGRQRDRGRQRRPGRSGVRSQGPSVRDPAARRTRPRTCRDPIIDPDPDTEADVHVGTILQRGSSYQAWGNSASMTGRRDPPISSPPTA